MNQSKTISFRTEAEKIRVLDGLASLQDRDRTYLLNEALDHYLELHRSHTAEIVEGVRQADAGQLMDHADLKRKIARRRAKK